MAAKDRKALGTGLGVLFGEDDFTETAESVQTLPIAKIEPRIEQPRDYFDEEALQTLADSIARYGLIQPITVRKLDTGFFQIIAGERRWRAARLANLEEVPVRIIEADDRLTAELALVENLQREDLNPLEEARGYKVLIEDYGLTQEEVAASLGKSRPVITNALRLLSLCPSVLDLVEKGELSAGHARALVTISDPEVQLASAKEIITKNLSVRKAEAIASKLGKAQTAKKPEQENSSAVDYTTEISGELSKILGRKVHLTDGKKTGKIEIEYYGPEDREALIEKLRKL